MKKTKFLFTAFLMLNFNLFYAQKSDLIYFEKNSFDLTDIEKKKVQLFFQNHPLSINEMIQISGYTDSDGNPENNLELSKKRIETILNILTKSGIPSTRLLANYYGEKNPIANNQLEEGKEKNRRVEMKIIQPNPSEIYNRFRKEPQKFKGNPKEIILIKGKEGTLIEIPKYSLVNPQNRTITGEVEIQLEEFYTASDIILANLHTLSDGKILETGGMINIVIKYKNEELKLKNGSEIKIEFATNDMERMETFYGEEKNGKFNWKLDTKSILEPFDKNQIETDTIVLDSVNRKNSTPITKPQPKKYLVSNKLKWINCDRFLNMNPSELTTLKVKTNLQLVDVKIIFKDINSIMWPATNNEDLYSFLNLPLNYQIQIIGFTEIDGETFFARKEIDIKEDEEIELNLEKIKTEDLKIELDKNGFKVGQISKYSQIQIR